MLIRDALHRIDRRLWAMAEGEPAAAPGGGQPAGDPPANPAPDAATPADKGPDMLKQIETLMTAAMRPMMDRMEAMEKRMQPEAKPTPAAHADPKPKTDPPAAEPAHAAEMAAAKAAADKAMGMARQAKAEAHLAGLERPEYMRLAPEVQLDDAGQLTQASREALDKFRAENPKLFKNGNTGAGAHTPGPGGPGGTEHTSEDVMAFAIHHIDPTKTNEKLRGNPITALFGFQAKPPHRQQQGGAA